MSEGSGPILAWAFIVAFGGVIVAALIERFVINRRPGKVVIDEPYGDATETPKMIHNARRVNHERVK